MILEILIDLLASTALALLAYTFGYMRARKRFETGRAKNGQFMRAGE